MRWLLFVFFLVLLPACGWAAEAGFSESFLLRFEALGASSSNRFFLLAAIACATLISEDLACIGAGLLAARGIISPFEAVLASAVGIYVGDVLLYLCGYLIGVGALRHAPLKWFVTERGVARGKRLFERRGLVLIFLCRFIPGTRTATFIGAGLVGVNLTRLLVVFAAAVLIWTPVLVLGSMMVGRQAIHYVEIYSANALWVFLVLLLGLFFLTRFLVPLCTWRGRRLLLGRWRRVSRWEFWPYYVVNIVTLVYVLYLGCFRYRNPTLFTAVNPAIEPDGGFVDESKADIMEQLPQDLIGRYQLVDASCTHEQRCRAVEEFMAAQRLVFPIVLKPNRGQRGQGVAICHDEDQVRAWLAGVEGEFIVMEFLPGEEFGVFYYRMPGAAGGRVFSITRKTFPTVCGDGVRTMEELILADDRAVCLAPLLLRELEHELDDVPPAGDVRQLVQVGAHSRGSLFLDGNHLLTDKLEGEIEAIARQTPGFYFGRYDIKAPSEADFKAGRKLRIIELNGVTSEATHMYDPAHSLVYAWKTLMHHWEIAFAIAAANEKQGHRPMKPRPFLRHVLQYWGL